MQSSSPLLDIRNLSVEFPNRHGSLFPVEDVSLHIEPGEILGVVGESGAGKSMTGAAVIGLIEAPGYVSSGEILFDGNRLDTLSYEEMRQIRGRQIGAIFQDPLTSLNPLHTVGRQISDTIMSHLGLTQKQARARALDLLREVGIPAADERINHYPHQFSGGMRQRVVIALALAAEPRLIIADEPTTALDVSIQAQIISLLKRMCREQDTAIMLITHDMGVIIEAANRVAVMYAGKVAEVGPVSQVVHDPKSPYTAGLMGSIPSLTSNAEKLAQISGSMPRVGAMPGGCRFHPRCPYALPRCAVELPPLEIAGDCKVACWLYHDNARPGPVGPAFGEGHRRAQQRPLHIQTEELCKINGLKQHFDVSPPFLTRLINRTGRQTVRAVDDFNLKIRRGETFGLVGESGCGKSTVARTLVGLYKPTAGNIALEQSRTAANGTASRVQMIFQDPQASLNPRWRVSDVIAETLPPGTLREARVGKLLRQVGLSESDGVKYPHEFSGGQRQRISIARALAAEPEFLICDEPTSALDVSVQAQILNLMVELQEQLGLTYLFISHDLAVVRHISTRVGIMYLGRLVEWADTDVIFDTPRHPYTRLLLDSIPDLSKVGRTRSPLAGEVPSPLNPPSGCPFHPRCPIATELCKSERPAMIGVESAHVACHAVQEEMAVQYPKDLR